MSKQKRTKVTIESPDGKVKVWISTKGRYFSARQWKQIIGKVCKLIRKSEIIKD